MPEAPVRHVFVYGTLRAGGRNDIRRLRPAPVYAGRAEVSGRLYSLGWYPGLLLGGADAEPVVGEVYAIDAALEAVLDRIEAIVPGPDSEYFKREIEVEVDGRRIECLVYEANAAAVRGRPRLSPADWIRFHETEK